MGGVCLSSPILFFALTFDKYNTDFIGRLITFVAIGVIFSHIMRDVIKKTRLLQRTLNQQIVGFILITLFFATVVGYLDTLLTSTFDIRIEQEGELTETEMVISNSFYAFRIC